METSDSEETDVNIYQTFNRALHASPETTPFIVIDDDEEEQLVEEQPAVIAPAIEFSVPLKAVLSTRDGMRTVEQGGVDGGLELVLAVPEGDSGVQTLQIVRPNDLNTIVIATSTESKQCLSAILVSPIPMLFVVSVLIWNCSFRRMQTTRESSLSRPSKIASRNRSDASSTRSTHCSSSTPWGQCATTLPSGE
jgi:hypothetical protein